MFIWSSRNLFQSPKWHRIGGDVTTPAANETCVALIKEYITHSNAGRKAYNDTLLHAQQYGLMLEEPLVPMLEMPAWSNNKEHIT